LLKKDGNYRHKTITNNTSQHGSVRWQMIVCGSSGEIAAPSLTKHILVARLSYQSP
jgi:hypothetical protein